MKIYLQPENRSSLGDDTFWTWMERTCRDATFDVPSDLQPSDVLLRYSTCRDPIPRGGRKFCLAWELYPEMQRRLDPGGDGWRARIAQIERCCRECDAILVPTDSCHEFYEHIGLPIHTLPIGVDTGLFYPARDREAEREKHALPPGATIGFWCGTRHPMKGADRLERMMRDEPEMLWVLVWKHERDYEGALPNAAQFSRITQKHLASLMRCADFFLASGRLRQWAMVEWEAMASGLRCVDLSGLDRDYEPRGENTVYDAGWDRPTAYKRWMEFLKS